MPRHYYVSTTAPSSRKSGSLSLLHLTHPLFFALLFSLSSSFFSLFSSSHFSFVYVLVCVHRDDEERLARARESLSTLIHSRVRSHTHTTHLLSFLYNLKSSQAHTLSHISFSSLLLSYPFRSKSYRLFAPSRTSSIDTHPLSTPQSSQVIGRVCE